MASQEGKYLAKLLSNYTLAPVPSDPGTPSAGASAAAAAAPSEPPRRSAGPWGRFWGAPPAGKAAAPAVEGAERHLAHIGVHVPLPEGAPIFKWVQRCALRAEGTGLPGWDQGARARVRERVMDRALSAGTWSERPAGRTPPAHHISPPYTRLSMS